MCEQNIIEKRVCFTALHVLQAVNFERALSGWIFKFAAHFCSNADEPSARGDFCGAALRVTMTKR